MAEVQQGETTGTYLYGVIPASLAAKLKDVIGVEDATVSTIASGDLAAVISEVPTRDEMRPERKHLSAHQAVLNRLADMSPVVLPVSFGTIAESPQGVQKLLKEHHQELSSQMRKVEGKVEMRIRVSYATEKPNIYEFLVASDPQLRKLRDTVAGKGAQATREDKIDLGQRFEAVLSDVRDQNSEKLEKALGKLGEIRRNPPRGEKELINVACLIPKGKQRDFEAAVNAAAQQFPDSFSLQQFGPFPPYDFVELHLKSGE